MTPNEDLFRLTGVGVAQTDLETGRFLRVNQAFCEMVGYSEAELQGMTNAELTHPEDWERDGERFAAMQRGELRGDTAVTRVLHKDGHEVWLELAHDLARLADACALDPMGLAAHVHALLTGERTNQTFG